MPVDNWSGLSTHCRTSTLGNASGRQFSIAEFGCRQLQSVRQLQLVCQQLCLGCRQLLAYFFDFLHQSFHLQKNSSSSYNLDIATQYGDIHRDRYIECLGHCYVAWKIHNISVITNLLYDLERSIFFWFQLVCSSCDSFFPQVHHHHIFFKEFLSPLFVSCRFYFALVSSNFNWTYFF